MRKNSILKWVVELGVFLTIIISLVLSNGIKAKADDPETFTSGKWTYCEEGDGICILSYTGTEAELTIPAEIDGKKVIRVAGIGPDYTYNYQRAVIVSEGIEVLDSNLFPGFSGLRRIMIPDSVKALSSPIRTYEDKSSMFLPYDLVIYCNEGSEAQKYSEEHGLTWHPMDEYAEDVELDNIIIDLTINSDYYVTWYEEGESIRIERCKISNKRVRIPEEIGGYPIKAVDLDNFYLGVTGILLPDSIIEIAGIPSSVLYCNNGSEAQKYAEENGIKWIPFDTFDADVEMDDIVSELDFEPDYSKYGFIKSWDGDGIRIKESITWSNIAIPDKLGDYPVVAINLSRIFGNRILIPDTVNYLMGTTTGILYCNEGSSAQKYAENHGINWLPADQFDSDSELDHILTELRKETTLEIAWNEPGKNIKITGCDNYATEIVIPEKIGGYDVVSISMQPGNPRAICIPDTVNEIIWYLPEGTLIYCNKGSKAQKYADEYGHKWLPLELYGEYAERVNSVNELQNDCDFIITWDGDGIRITGYKGDDTKIRIPELIGEYPVVAVDYSGFNRDALAKILVPDSVKSVYSYLYREETTVYCNIGSEAQKHASEHNIKWFPQEFFDNDIDTDLLYELSWDESDNGLKIYKYNGNETNVVIPERIGDYPVVSIGNQSFEGSNLVSVIIPEGVTIIRDFAFMDCNNLERIEIPESVTKIGNMAFYACFSLKEIDIPDTVTEIGNEVFENCRSLSSIEIPQGITKLGTRCFMWCDNLTSINIPNCVNDFHPADVRGCYKLKEIKLEDDNPYYASVNGIICNKDKTEVICVPPAFSSVIIPEGIKGIQDWAMSYSKNLSYVALPESIEFIELCVFSNCPNLSCIDVPESFKYVVNNFDPDRPIYGNSFGSTNLNGSENGTGGGGSWYYNYHNPKNIIVFCKEGSAAENSAKQSDFTVMPRDIPFSDVTRDKFYADSVRWAYYSNPQITAGNTATEFAPNVSCNRAQIVTFLWRMMGCPEPKLTESPFEDVAPGKYYSKAVLWAYENEIVMGITEKKFKPYNTCTRSQFVTFLWRAAGQPELTEDEKTKAPTFADIDENAFYADAVRWAAYENITTGINETRFAPNNKVNRAQTVTFLFRSRFVFSGNDDEHQ